MLLSVNGDNILLSVNRDNKVSIFLLLLLNLMPFICCVVTLFLWLWIPVLYWIKVVRVGIPKLLLIMEKKTFGSSPLSLILAAVLWYTAIILLKYFFSILTLLRVCIMNGCWILLNVFFLLFLRCLYELYG